MVVRVCSRGKPAVSRPHIRLILPSCSPRPPAVKRRCAIGTRTWNSLSAREFSSLFPTENGTGEVASRISLAKNDPEEGRKSASTSWRRVELYRGSIGRESSWSSSVTSPVVSILVLAARLRSEGIRIDFLIDCSVGVRKVKLKRRDEYRGGITGGVLSVVRVGVDTAHWASVTRTFLGRSIVGIIVSRSLMLKILQLVISFDYAIAVVVISRQLTGTSRGL